ncbi:LppM family (lipo)protein [Brachybacterium fresconis]|uniref:LppM domain-containing protein n=1 Tax=Brachybacterium fresconis TaxID=173363 RepID=A0ABS4YJE5_9MICO|nr:proline-rich domain-containing protein [Brachybacterium fresconis]MBP2408931.1 hypothetical protein [Brachybacterium fresconis]
MNTISARRRLIAVLVLPFVLLLSGCGRLSADFDIKDIDTIALSMDFGLDKNVLEKMGESFDSPDAMCEDLMGDANEDLLSAPVEAYEDGDIWGCRISGTSTRADFGSGLDLTEQDGEYHLILDLGSEGINQSDLDALGSLYGIDVSAFEFEISFTFPGKVIESQGGTVDGNTVTYTDVTEFSQGVDITAEADGFPWIVVIIIVVVVGFILLLAIAAVIFFVIRARRNKGGSAGPGAPGVNAPAAFGGAAGAASMSTGNAPPATPQGGQPWGPTTPPPAAPQGDQGQQGQPWNQPPQSGQQGQPWNQPPQPGQQGDQGQQWGQVSPPAAPQGDQGQPWNQPPQPGQEDGGSQPPQDPWSRPPQPPGQ